MNAQEDSDPTPVPLAVPPPVTPPTHPVVDDQPPPTGPSMVGTPRRMIALCLASLAVMAPWPLLGMLVTRSLFDESSEAFLLFGGITLFPLALLALLTTVSDELHITLLMIAWLAAAIAPNLWLHRRLRSRTSILILLGVQSAFSFAQAGMGALLIIGKSV